MAHEINNPLAYVKANLKVLDEYRDSLQEVLQAYDQLDKRFSGAELPENIRRCYDEITALRKKLNVSDILGDSRDLIAESQGGVDRIKNIVKSLQKFSDSPKAEPEWADINSILENTLTLVGSEVMRKASLVKDFGELPKVKCYPEELSQVFINLVSNALNAITAQGEIIIRTYAKGDMVVVKVKDNGTGITAEQLPKIFDPFYSSKGVGNSQGLGLSIAHGVVKKHGGEIKVESQPGKGSTFTIELPVGK
jgi:two-component system, NtrC family, sensor kinase